MNWTELFCLSLHCNIVAPGSELSIVTDCLNRFEVLLWFDFWFDINPVQVISVTILFCANMKAILRELVLWRVLGIITLPLWSPLLRILWSSSGRNESRGRPSPLRAPPCRTQGTSFCFEFVSLIILTQFYFTTQHFNFQYGMSTSTEFNNLNTSCNLGLRCF